jgi:hypothetical protein
LLGCARRNRDCVKFAAGARIVVNNLVKSLGPFAITLFAGALVIGAPTGALAEARDFASVSADWDAVNQVLEIPQVCAKDGVVVTCKQPDSDMSTVDGAATGADGSSSADSSTEEVSSVDDSDGAPAWGTLQDYENQQVASGPVAAYVPAGSGAALPLSAYVVPVRPPAPLSPMVAPGRLRIFGPATSPWMSPPRMATGPAALPLTMPGRGLPFR